MHSVAGFAAPVPSNSLRAQAELSRRQLCSSRSSLSLARCRPHFSSPVHPDPPRPSLSSRLPPQSPAANMPGPRVAYQGSPGAYSEAAALAYFTPSSGECTATFVPCASFGATFDALASGAADRVMLPIENSLAGTIHENLDKLLRHADVSIVGEHDFRVRHCLLAAPGTGLADIRVARSHYMALGQCRGWLEKAGIPAEVAEDTAGSAARISEEGLENCAAVASRRAADIYGLDVVAEGIEDVEENFTRFLVLAKCAVDGGAGREEGAWKTSVAFTLNNVPGALYRALSVFSVAQIDLTKIESRHVHTVIDAVADVDEKTARRWGYVFYIDVGGGVGSESVGNALRSLQQVTPFFRCLGSYRACVVPKSTVD